MLRSFISKAVLANVRVPVTGAEHARAFAPAMLQQAIRLYSEGTYLDKGQVTDRVLGVVKNFQKVDPAKVSADSTFSKDLGLDSLDTVEVVMAFEEEFAIEIPDAEADKITSCSDAIAYISAHPNAA